MNFFKRNGWIAQGFQAVAILNSFAVLLVVAVYAYGGLFARYLADDYCEVTYLFNTKNIFDATIKAYYIWLNNYSILIFVQLTEWAGLWGVRLMVGVTLGCWLICLAWFVSEVGKTLGLRFSLAVTVWIAGLVIFITLYQISVLYQILYWRSGLIPYTIPLVFFVGIAAFILWYARLTFQKSRAIWAGILFVGLVFFAGGLGETTSALQVGILAVAILIVWLTKSAHQRKDIFVILVVAFVAAVASILIIALSPGVTTRLGIIMKEAPVYNPIELSVDVIVFTSKFLLDVLKTTPLPNIIAVIAPLGIMYWHSSNGEGHLAQIPSGRLRLALLATLVFMFIIVGCSFAPSAFARTFPFARSRSAAYFIVTLSLVFAGGLLGILISRIRMPVKTDILVIVVIGLLGLLTLYPLLAASKISGSLYEYQKFASAWDERDAYIRKSVTAGAKDLVVTQLDSIGGVLEYKDKPASWVNACAAQYYGLNSLTAP